jgi:Tfp pilus assembly protein PilN
MINLLPPKYKEELRLEENLNLILILEILFFASLLSLALILFSIKIHLASLIEEEKIFYDSKNKEFSQHKPVEAELNSINKTLAQLDSFYKEQFELTDFLERISKLLPPAIYLTSFSYQEGKKINLSGFSPTVENLLELKNNLEKQADFKDLNFPPTLWLQPVNINFNISLSISSEILWQKK